MKVKIFSVIIAILFVISGCGINKFFSISDEDFMTKLEECNDDYSIVNSGFYKTTRNIDATGYSFMYVVGPDIFIYYVDDETRDHYLMNIAGFAYGKYTKEKKDTLVAREEKDGYICYCKNSCVNL